MLCWNSHLHLWLFCIYFIIYPFGFALCPLLLLIWYLVVLGGPPEHRDRMFITWHVGISQNEILFWFKPIRSYIPNTQFILIARYGGWSHEFWKCVQQNSIMETISPDGCWIWNPWRGFRTIKKSIKESYVKWINDSPKCMCCILSKWTTEESVIQLVGRKSIWERSPTVICGKDRNIILKKG